MTRALLWDALPGSMVRCRLCAHGCTVAPGATGRCAVRRNVGGVLQSLNYGKVVSANADPVEKKPLFHFLPGSRTFSVAAMGCNFRCAFCQNSGISQAPRDEGAIEGRSVTPAQVVSLAKAARCPSIAHTYTEPTVYAEHALETAKLALDAGLKTVFVSNGFQSPEAVELMAPLVHAINIDLKCFDDRTYREVIGGRLQPVCDNIAAFHRKGVLVEVTTLVIPGLNDSDDELRATARFLVSVDPCIPWHVSAFHPDYRMLDRPPTPAATLRRARSLGLAEGLSYVYCGNVSDEEGETTFCRGCHAPLLRRRGFSVIERRLTAEGTCPDCGVRQHVVLA